ncbi:VanZ family protein [Lysinibacillus sphaericus]|uniref:VanZ family protein n=1 Tax=Lysinibacillus sphaericus TaxID=1421 RepID=UPI0034DB1984
MFSFLLHYQCSHTLYTHLKTFFTIYLPTFTLLCYNPYTEIIFSKLRDGQEFSRMFKTIWKSFFTIYILMLLIFVVFKFNGDVYSVINTIRTNKDRGVGVNLIPFSTIGAYISDINDSVSIINILGNIIPFIPMGFIIPMAFPSQRNVFKTLISSLLLILSIEILQIILFLGSFDIDDIILNLLSCIIGFMLFITYKNIFKVVS